MTSTNMNGASPFTESIILATICSRTLAHKQQSTAERVYNHMPQLFWDRHEWLYSMLKTRYDYLTLQYPSAMQHTDCLLLFTKMMVQSNVLYLCRVIESIPWETNDYRSAIVDFKQKALLAAKETVNLTRSLPHISFFKVINSLVTPPCSCPRHATTPSPGSYSSGSYLRCQYRFRSKHR